jgi:Mor family transcriptional regulator
VRYIKAEEVLPEDVLRQVQQYVDGVNLYIPRKAENRRAWGCGTQYKSELAERNAAIRAGFAGGEAVGELAEKFHLSEKSIRRILRKK